LNPRAPQQPPFSERERAARFTGEDMDNNLNNPNNQAQLPPNVFVSNYPHERIRACMAACEGIPSELLTPGCVKRLVGALRELESAFALDVFCDERDTQNPDAYHIVSDGSDVGSVMDLPYLAWWLQNKGVSE
jgi:hypothetical protein